jgi:hypothetical protein
VLGKLTFVKKLANSPVLTVTINFLYVSFILPNKRLIFYLELFVSTLGGGLAPSNQTVGSLLRTPGWQSQLGPVL